MTSIPSSRSKSGIWFHFEKVESRTGNKGKCRYCHAEISITGGATSNLRRHMSKKHITIPIERHDEDEGRRLQEGRARSRSHSEELRTTLSSSSKEISLCRPHRTLYDTDSPSPVTACPSTSTPSVSTSSPTVSLSPLSLSTPQTSMTRFVQVIKPIPVTRSRQIDIQLLKMICAEYHPFSLVEDKEFKTFVQMLCPNYTLPSRKTLSQGLLNSVHESLITKITKMLEDTDAVCITCDGWTSLNTTSFYAITAHFIDNNSISLKSVLLECSEFPEKHTGENISNWIRNVTTKFNIHFKIAAVVTDNAANIKSAVNILKLRHLSCFAHSLNLVVQQAISESIKDVVDKAKSIVQFFKQSSQATTKLGEMQTSLNKKRLKLKQDVPTRWNSTFDMLDRIFKNQEPVISVLAILHPKLLLGDREWKVIEESVSVLQIFFEVTEEVSSENSISLSKTCILARGMAKSVKQTVANSQGRNLTDEVMQLAKNLSEGLSARFGNRENIELVNQSVFLDPRFKKHGFGENASLFSEIKNQIVEKIQSTIVEVPKPAEAVRTTGGQSTSSIWEEFDASVNKLVATQDTKASAIVQVDKYLAEPLLDRRMDPLVWWHERKTIFPDLFHLVKRRLCIPATSVPCERIFSKAGNICTERRSRLTSSKVSKILLICHNSELI